MFTAYVTCIIKLIFYNSYHTAVLPVFHYVFVDFVFFSSEVCDKVISIVDKWAFFDLKVCVTSIRQ